MVLEYVDFITGAISVGFAYALFKDNIDPEEEAGEEDDQNYEDDEEGSGRLVTISCQGCRKLKKHREIKHNVYKCTKCKRIVDLS